MSAMPEEKDKAQHPVRLIKKYPNRRLYDTKTSSYITLADVKQMVVKQEDFQVIDAKSGDDLTRQILLQIILEEESGGMPMFSSDLLSQMIRSYGSAMQGFMGSYLEKNLEGFQQKQKAMTEQFQKKIDEAVQAVAEKGGFTAVLDEGGVSTIQVVLYAHPSVDLTEQVIREFDRRNK